MKIKVYQSDWRKPDVEMDCGRVVLMIDGVEYELIDRSSSIGVGQHGLQLHVDGQIEIHPHAANAVDITVKNY